MTSFPDPADPAGSRTEVFLRHLDVVAELAGGPTAE